MVHCWSDFPSHGGGRVCTPCEQTPVMRPLGKTLMFLAQSSCSQELSSQDSQGPGGNGRVLMAPPSCVLEGVTVLYNMKRPVMVPSTSSYMGSFDLLGELV